MKSKAQISTQFHWIFIVIAGAIILIFFIGIVMKQKDVAEQHISATVLSDFEQILAGAAAREKTVNKIEIPKEELIFTCTAEGYSEYSVKNTGLHRETPTDVIFAPDNVKGPLLYTWTLDFQAPFRVVNFLMITSSKVRYYIVHDGVANSNSQIFAQQIYDELPKQITKEIISNRDILSLKDKKDYKVRLVFAATAITEIPQSLQYLKEDISAVRIYPEFAQFYANQNNQFSTTQDDKLPLLQFQENDPMLYAAIFAENSEAYKCAMKKAFKRLSLIAEINKARAGIFPENEPPGCSYLHGVTLFEGIGAAARECFNTIDENCIIHLKKVVIGDATTVGLADYNAALSSQTCYKMY